MLITVASRAAASRVLCAVSMKGRCSGRESELLEGPVHQGRAGRQVGSAACTPCRLEDCALVPRATPAGRSRPALCRGPDSASWLTPPSLDRQSLQTPGKWTATRTAGAPSCPGFASGHLSSMIGEAQLRQRLKREEGSEAPQAGRQSLGTHGVQIPVPGQKAELHLTLQGAGWGEEGKVRGRFYLTSFPRGQHCDQRDWQVHEEISEVLAFGCNDFNSSNVSSRKKSTADRFMNKEAHYSIT